MTRQLSLDLIVPLEGRSPGPPRRTPRSVSPAERAHLRHRLELLFDSPLERLTLTDNRVTILSSRPSRTRPAALELRIHACFVDAPQSILKDIVVCSTEDSRTSRARVRRGQSLERVREFFDRHGPTEPRRRRLKRPRPKGTVYDLARLFAELNRDYFGDEIEATITWGRARRSRARRRRSLSIQLGSYDYEDRRIRVHPILDALEVPQNVVAAVVHHEMVHAFLGSSCKRAHGPAFRALEQRFVGLREADDWLDTHLEKLIVRAERAARLG